MSVRHAPIAVLCALVALLAAGPSTAAAETVVSCPFDDGSSGDNITRGFYVTGYPGTNLDQVTLQYQIDVAGDYAITLTARSGTYDGPLIGAKSVSVSLPNTAQATVPVTFQFGGAPVATGSTITFAQSSTGPASLSYNTGIGPCPGVTQTNGTTPPLSTVRRDSVGVTITQLPSGFSYALRGRALEVHVALPGTVAVSDAAAPRSAQEAKKKRSLTLKPSSASGTAPTISVPLRLTKSAKKKLRKKGQVTVNARITFTPTGGTVGTQTAKLKIKAKKKK